MSSLIDPIDVIVNSIDSIDIIVESFHKGYLDNVLGVLDS